MEYLFFWKTTVHFIAYNRVVDGPSFIFMRVELQSDTFFFLYINRASRLEEKNITALQGRL